MTEAQTALAAAFAAAILTAIGARVIAGYQAKRDAEQRALDRELQRAESLRADERNLRDAKRERLRRDYEAVAFAATEIRGATTQLSILWSGDTEEARNARVNDRLAEATKDLGRAILRLRLEGVQELVNAYETVYSTWFNFTGALAAAQQGASASNPYSQMAEHLTKLETAVDAIIDRTKTDLDALSKPI